MRHLTSDVELIRSGHSIRAFIELRWYTDRGAATLEDTKSRSRTVWDLLAKAFGDKLQAKDTLVLSYGRTTIQDPDVYLNRYRIILPTFSFVNTETAKSFYEHHGLPAPAFWEWVGLPGNTESSDAARGTWTLQGAKLSRETFIQCCITSVSGSTCEIGVEKPSPPLARTVVPVPRWKTHWFRALQDMYAHADTQGHRFFLRFEGHAGHGAAASALNIPTERWFGSYASASDFYQHAFVPNPGRRVFHEIWRRDRPGRLHLDVEWVHDKEPDPTASDRITQLCDLITRIVPCTLHVLPGSRWTVPGSKYKHSYHLVAPDIWFENHEASKPFVDELIAKTASNPLLQNIIDTQVYSANHSIRCPGCWKLDDPARVPFALPPNVEYTQCLVTGGEPLAFTYSAPRPTKKQKFVQLTPPSVTNIEELVLPPCMASLEDKLSKGHHLLHEQRNNYAAFYLSTLGIHKAPAVIESKWTPSFRKAYGDGFEQRFRQVVASNITHMAKTDSFSKWGCQAMQRCGACPFAGPGRSSSSPAIQEAMNQAFHPQDACARLAKHKKRIHRPCEFSLVEESV